jgi:hypothetical protein
MINIINQDEFNERVLSASNHCSQEIYALLSCLVDALEQDKTIKITDALITKALNGDEEIKASLENQYMLNFYHVVEKEVNRITSGKTQGIIGGAHLISLISFLLIAVIKAQDLVELPKDLPEGVLQPKNETESYESVALATIRVIAEQLFINKKVHLKQLLN